MPRALTQAAARAALHMGSLFNMERHAVRKGKHLVASDQEVPLAYTLPGASRTSGLSVSTLRRRGKEGVLRLFRCGGRMLVDGASLRRMLGTE
jgi:hypothetical protein